MNKIEVKNSENVILIEFVCSNFCKELEFYFYDTLIAKQNEENKDSLIQNEFLNTMFEFLDFKKFEHSFKNVIESKTKIIGANVFKKLKLNESNNDMFNPYMCKLNESKHNVDSKIVYFDKFKVFEILASLLDESTFEDIKNQITKMTDYKNGAIYVTFLWMTILNRKEFFQSPSSTDISDQSFGSNICNLIFGEDRGIDNDVTQF
jgi:hypothetical protein